MIDEARRHARKRGRILRNLEVEHPDWLTLTNLRNLLDDLGASTRTESVLSYVVWLEAKGYVETTRKKGDRSRVSIDLVRITPKGLDLIDANNNLSDEGVEL